ncbi:MAG: hypothetical protein ABT00_17715 [Bordetella sp. SCN 68-11]|nr:MAG: hypothetical protein ABT00_17715 [Bordetella sp. SCN 68-11]
MNDDEKNSNTGNYIQSITTPAGVTLAEFSNGAYSGWMYTLNGTHPLLGVNEQKVANGDILVFHYTDDYRVEEGSDKWGTPDTGNPSSAAGAVIEQPAAISGKTATASIHEKSIASAIEAAKRSDGVVTVSPTATGNATDIRVTIPKAAVKSAADQSVSLTVETGCGNVMMPPETLSQLVSSASDGDVMISVQKKTAGDVANKGIYAENAVIAEITVTSGGKAITAFGGKAITVALPVGSTYSEGGSYNVVILSADGTIERTTGKCVKKGGSLLVEVTATHLSTFVVTNTKAMKFSDVKPSAWYYGAAKYACDNGLFGGTSDATFSPDAAMTRAMLVTVLYRMEGSPAAAAASTFSDVKAGQYYTDAVIWASANGIVGGYDSGSFGPADHITREQLAAILYRYASYKKYDVSMGEQSALTGYKDAASISAYAVPAMRWACGASLIQGDNGSLMPCSSATRAQAAAILMRFCQSAAK